MFSAVILAGLLLVGCAPSAPESQGPRQGVAAEIRNDIAFIPRTNQRYSGSLVTHYWNGEYLHANYLNGRLHGTWTRYSREGEVLMHVCFENGNPIECRR